MPNANDDERRHVRALFRVPTLNESVTLLPAVAGKAIHLVSAVITPQDTADCWFTLVEEGSNTPIAQVYVTATGIPGGTSLYFGERGFRLGTGLGLNVVATGTTAGGQVTITGYVGR